MDQFYVRQKIKHHREGFSNTFDHHTASNYMFMPYPFMCIPVLTRLMSQRMVNTMVLVLWIYLILAAQYAISLEQTQSCMWRSEPNGILTEAIVKVLPLALASSDEIFNDECNVTNKYKWWWQDGL